ncbi:hypothetical protein DL771_005063 [Monosporascus sp. 5C6A]|nr:hypothetical protein DL771_005063 [Monosporascus sp. 5C6A]
MASQNTADEQAGESSTQPAEESPAFEFAQQDEPLSSPEEIVNNIMFDILWNVNYKDNLKMELNATGKPLRPAGSPRVCPTCFNLDAEHISSGPHGPLYPGYVAPSTWIRLRDQIPDNMNFWTTLGKLESSARDNSCSICEFLSSGLDHFQMQRFQYSRVIEPGSEDLINCWILVLARSVKTHVWWAHHTTPEQYEFYHMFPTAIRATGSFVASPFGIGLPLDLDPGTPEFFVKIKTKLEEADNSNGKHTLCHAQAPSRVTPTRLLDLGDDPTAEVAKVRLSNPEQGVRYVALSHRWPQDPPPRLLSDTLKDGMPVEFPWDSLTKTFQDAVMVTKALGLRYIWIDSLCIIQDDNDDWEKEAALMGSVYNGAYVTIAANGSANEGNFRDPILREFFARQEQTYHSGRQSTMENDADHDAKGFLWRDRRLLGFVLQKNPQISVNAVYFRRVRASPPTDGDAICGHGWMRYRKGFPPPLLTRGWCFQERMASKRIIHFTPDEVFFECEDGYYCECTGMEEPMGCLKREVSGSFQYYRNEKSPGVAYGNPLLHWRIWKDVITEYSRTQFTYDEDVFPALIYLARKFHAESGMTYIAGLWKETLLDGLAWVALDNISASERPPRQRRPGKTGSSSYIAPSWSWASSAGAVGWNTLPDKFDNLTKEAALIDCGSTPAGVHPLGAVSSAFVRLQGRLAKISQSDFMYMLINGWECRKLARQLTFDAMYDGGAEGTKVYIDSDKLPLGTESLYLFRLSRFEREPAPGDRRQGPLQCAIALILRPQNEGSIGKFTRVGIALQALDKVFDKVEAVEVILE